MSKRERDRELGGDVARLALPLLVERLGGVVEISEAELDAFLERHAEPGLAPGVRIETTERGIRLTIVHAKKPSSDA